MVPGWSRGDPGVIPRWSRGGLGVSLAAARGRRVRGSAPRALPHVTLPLPREGGGAGPRHAPYARALRRGHVVPRASRDRGGGGARGPPGSSRRDRAGIGIGTGSGPSAAPAEPRSCPSPASRQPGAGPPWTAGTPTERPPACEPPPPSPGPGPPRAPRRSVTRRRLLRPHRSPVAAARRWSGPSGAASAGERGRAGPPAGTGAAPGPRRPRPGHSRDIPAAPPRRNRRAPGRDRPFQAHLPAGSADFPARAPR